MGFHVNELVCLKSDLTKQGQVAGNAPTCTTEACYVIRWHDGWIGSRTESDLLRVSETANLWQRFDALKRESQAVADTSNAKLHDATRKLDRAYESLAEEQIERGFESSGYKRQIAAANRKIKTLESSLLHEAECARKSLQERDELKQFAATLMHKRQPPKLDGPPTEPGWYWECFPTGEFNIVSVPPDTHCSFPKAAKYYGPLQPPIVSTQKPERDPAAPPARFEWRDEDRFHGSGFYLPENDTMYFFVGSGPVDRSRMCGGPRILHWIDPKPPWLE